MATPVSFEASGAGMQPKRRTQRLMDFKRVADNSARLTNQKIAEIQALLNGRSQGSTAPVARTRRTMSTPARRRIAAAQKKRWAVLVSLDRNRQRFPPTTAPACLLTPKPATAVVFPAHLRSFLTRR